MEGSKIKNVIIVILILLNGFLFLLVGGRRFQDSHSHETAVNSAIQIIRDGGVELDESTVPREMSLKRMQAVRDLDREKELAAGLLGGEVSVQARGGEVYRYQNGNGWIQFHSTGEFLAEFAPGAFPSDAETAQHGIGLLAALGFEGQVLENGVADGEGELLVRQSLGGVPLLGCQATLNYRDGSLVSISDGRRLLGTPYESGGESSLPVATALMRLYNGMKELGDIYNRLESITPAYTLTVSLSGPAQLTPVWYIKTDTGAYQMDTRTGQVSRVAEAGETAVLTDGQMVLTEE